MSQLTKQQLKGENQTQFPNNNVGAITPSNLRAFNVDMIDSTVNQTDFTNFSGSVASEFANLTASVDPSITGSSLITASFDNGTRNLTFTKGDASTFAVNIPDVSGSGTINTGSFATTGSNNFIGNQNVDGRVIISGSSILTNNNYLLFTRPGAGDIFRIGMSDNGQTYDFTVTGSTNQQLWLIDNQGGTYINTFQAPIIATNNVRLEGGFTASLQDGYAWVGNASGKNSQVPTSSFSGGGGSIDTASFATTGSNTFRGIETFEDAGGNATSLVPRSGSLILVAKGYTSASAHLTSSANSFVNLIFKDNNFTSDTIISGSNNIFSNGDTPSTGFKKYIGSNNIFLASGSVPQITGSTAYPLTINNNFSNRGTISVAGPISASASSIQFNFFGQNGVNIGAAGANNAEKLVGGFTFNTNLVLAGNPTIIANQNFITGSSTISNNQFITSPTIAVSSSAVSIQGNLFNAGLNLRNAYWSSSIGLGGLTVARNIIQGSTHVITFTGSQPTGTTNAPQFGDNQLMGTNLNAFVDVSGSDVAGTAANHSILSTMLQGYQMTVTGSSAAASNNFGSAFFGRYNAQDGNRSKTAQTIFAVGTGNATTRKTGFLIDSGSNTFIEGTLNVSGSTTMTGSLLISSSATYDLIITGAARVASQNGLQTNTIGANTFNIDTTRDASVNAENYIFGSTASVSSIYVGVYDSPAFNTDVELKISTDSNGISFNDWDNVDAAYENWLTLDANVGNNPIPAFTRGLNVINGTSLSLAQNSQGSGSQYSQVSIFADTATNPADVYAGFQVLDASNSNAGLLQMAANSYTAQYGGQTVGWIGGGGNNPAGNTTAIIFRTGSALMEVFKPTTFAYDISLTGSLYIQSGSTLPVSTGSAILTWDVATGQVKQAPFSTIVSASVSSAEFWSTTTQSGSAGVSGSITFNNSGSFYNVSLVNGKELKVANAGVYNIQFSAQIETSAGADTIYLWFKKNGTNIGASASKAVLANNTAQIMTVNILDEAAANDYYEIAYQNVNGHATVLAEAASGNIPAIPSVIATIIQVR